MRENDNITLADYGLQPLSMLQLQSRLRGGMNFKKSLKCFNMWNEHEESSKENEDKIEYSEKMFQEFKEDENEVD